MTDAAPQVIEAEEQVLGSCMLAPVADNVTLVAEDFSRTAHQFVWTAIRDLVDAGSPVDPVSVWRQVCIDPEARRAVGSALALTDLIGRVVTVANVTYHADVVAEAARDRRLHTFGQRVQQLAASGASDKLTLTREWLDAVEGSTTAAETAIVGDLLDETLARLGEGAAAGVRTGLAELDEILAPMTPGQLLLVGARPSIGKSSVLLTIARNVCQEVKADGGSVDFCSLEMGREEVMHRLMASTGVPLASLRSGDMDDHAWDRVGKSMHLITDLPLYVDDRETLSLSDLRALGRRGLRRGMRLLVVDYAQLLATPRGDSRQTEVAALSRGLKVLAKSLGVPLLVACQLNRKSEDRGDHKPHLSDLRESGAWEMDADVVMLLHREDFYEKESVRAGEMDVIVAKQRNGPTGTAVVGWQGAYSRVVNLTGRWVDDPMQRGAA